MRVPFVVPLTVFGKMPWTMAYEKKEKKDLVTDGKYKKAESLKHF